MGSEPERDDGGLPPIDFEIPDDARELDRDVHAYHRELRAIQRRRRIRRLIAPFARHGMVIPLIAGMLAVTLFAATMLIVITSTPEPNTPMPKSSRGSAAPSVPAAGQLGGLLPSAGVLIDHRPSQLRDLGPSVLAVVPRGCGCLTALRQLTAQAVATQTKIYFVATGDWVKQVAELAGQSARGYVQVVDDVGNVLRTYRPIGLTAILVHSDSAVTSVLRRLNPGFRLQTRFQRLAAPGLGHTDSPTPG